MEVVASLSQGRSAAVQCGLFTHKSVPVIFEPPCILTISHSSLPTRYKLLTCAKIKKKLLWTKYKTSAICYSFTEATGIPVMDVMRKDVTLSM